MEPLPLPPIALVMASIVITAALGAMLLEDPVHAVLCFLGMAVGAAGLLLSLGFPGTATGAMWIFGGGAGLLLLTTALLLNLAPEEVGRRRFGMLRVVALMLVAWLGSALLATPAPASMRGAPASTGKMPTVAASSSLQADDQALLLALTSRFSHAVGALMLVRRRP
ncbi:MAG: hypothetical protein ACO3JL_11130 [Myxococcota bacterium]